MSLLTDRVGSSTISGETTSMWDLLFRRVETYENMVAKPLLASEMRILKEKMNDAFTQYENSKAKLEAHYVESRKKHPDDIDYEFSESLRMERQHLGSIYDKYANKHAEELARKEGRLEEYCWERQQEIEQEWDDYNHNISMYVDRY
jgi:RNase adaptor protein for sRNA GlmZ degradation